MSNTVVNGDVKAVVKGEEKASTLRFGSTRGQIVELLRRKTRTVNELSKILEVTDNAVRAHLRALEDERLVTAVGIQPSVRKPNTVFGLTAKAEVMFARAASPVLKATLSVLAEREGQQALLPLLREVGERMADLHRNAVAGKSFPARVRYASQVLTELGGIPRLEVCEGGHLLHVGACPFGEIAACHPASCQALESLLSVLLGVPVAEQCQRGDRPRCRFQVNRP